MLKIILSSSLFLTSISGAQSQNDPLREVQADLLNAARQASKTAEDGRRQDRLDRELFTAVINDDAAGTRRALAGGANVDGVNNWWRDISNNKNPGLPPYPIQTPLSIAVWRSNLEIVRILVEEYHANVNLIVKNADPLLRDKAVLQYAVEMYCSALQDSSVAFLYKGSTFREELAKKRRAWDIINVLLMDPRVDINTGQEKFEQTIFASFFGTVDFNITPLDAASRQCFDYGRLTAYLRSKGAKHSEFVDYLIRRGKWISNKD